MTQTPNGRVAERLAAGHRLNGRLVLAVGMAAAAALLVISVASGALEVRVAPATPGPPAYRVPPTTETPGQPGTGPATSGPVPTGRPETTSGVSGHQPGPARPAAGQETPARPTTPPATNPGSSPPGPPREVLLRVRIRAIGACLEVVAGIPPVRTCQQGGR
jgi:hypothetical protein